MASGKISRFPNLELDIENAQTTPLTQNDVDWIAPDDGYVVLTLNSTGGHWGYIGRYKSDNTIMLLDSNSTGSGYWSVSCSIYVKKGVKYRFSNGLDGTVFSREIVFYPFA